MQLSFFKKLISSSNEAKQLSSDSTVDPALQKAIELQKSSVKNFYNALEMNQLSLAGAMIEAGLNPLLSTDSQNSFTLSRTAFNSLAYFLAQRKLNFDSVPHLRTLLASNQEWVESQLKENILNLRYTALIPKFKVHNRGWPDSSPQESITAVINTQVGPVQLSFTARSYNRSIEHVVPKSEINKNHSIEIMVFSIFSNEMDFIALNAKELLTTSFDDSAAIYEMYKQYIDEAKKVNVDYIYFANLTQTVSKELLQLAEKLNLKQTNTARQLQQVKDIALLSKEQFYTQIVNNIKETTQKISTQDLSAQTQEKINDIKSTASKLLEKKETLSVEERVEINTMFERTLVSAIGSFLAMSPQYRLSLKDAAGRSPEDILGATLEKMQQYLSSIQIRQEKALLSSLLIEEKVQNKKTMATTA